ncbi:hypothetical protein B9G98_04599 [Wickerhamiella sorbophila]|uniref:MINDY deubiquitinase domain-containing protein n=1 Tax=Wickerhamiella sorbophila TaxID=45607 RepID=A0A2T0FPU1_9ASCO|nr:hypothetical protein B9G98_04599 [Wickerhamiella sorbophila]PRT56979.1 hypothetical protein B9G98_04599 [Wickerhamiella sorbophila]
MAPSKTFRTKHIEYNGPKTILVQNENGPCPLIATVNTLVIAGSPIVMSLLDKTKVTVEELREMMQEVCNVPGSTSAFHKFFPTLTEGLDINPRFNGTFAQTEELDLFLEFDLPLIHGWVITDSELPKKFAGVASKAAKVNFDDFNLDLIQGLNDEEKSVEWFIKHNPSQLSNSGLIYLQSRLKPDIPAVFFRNNHYATIILHHDVLYTLATDEGLAYKPAVWEALTGIEGAGGLCDADFNPIQPEPDVSQDEAIARALAREEQGSDQAKRDEELARKLNEKEQRRLQPRGQRQGSGTPTQPATRPALTQPKPKPKPKSEKGCIIV